MQSELTLRKRKACLTCTRAKAKCTPCDQSPDTKCQRCNRLSKSCVYEDSYKKPGPKSRSRVKQLEQRVESLIDLITTNNGGNVTRARDKTGSIQTLPAVAPTHPTPPITDSSPSAATEGGAPQPIPIGPLEGATFQPYDPIEAGVITEQHADHILREFKSSFALTFPFVVLESDTTASGMRQQQPFLLHAILAVAAYETPRVQCILGDEFRRQLARTVEYSCKSLEILQGLLVYAAWYHTFYHPRTQQMAFVVQTCVALVQDLGYDFNRKQKPILSSRMQFQGNSPTKPEDVVASSRAYLGTYALCISFAQAWRKRPSLAYTRYMAQCCESFKQSSVPTDELIPPVIQLCELWSRVNDHFSYDNIEYTEIHGELMLSISATAFRKEVQRIRDSAVLMPLAAKNTTLSLLFSALEIQIDECCIHSSLWRTTDDSPTIPPTLVRLGMFDRTMRAAMTYIQILLDLDKARLFQLSTQAWTAWFHIVIVICKLVFVRDHERLDDTPIEDLPAELGNILPHGTDDDRPSRPALFKNKATSSWEPLDVARQYDIQARLERFMDKLRFSLPTEAGPWSIPRAERDSMHSIACIQHLSLHGFTKAIKRFETVPPPVTSVPQEYSVVDAENASTIRKVTGQNHSNAVMASFMDGQTTHPTVRGSMPFASFMDFGTIDFDGVTLPDQFGLQQEHMDDWMWNTMMDDFSMPTW